MRTIFGWLRVLATPACWLTVGSYSEYWDLKLRKLMRKHNFTNVDGCSATLGPIKVWIANHPYRSFCYYRYQDGVVIGPRPKRITALRAMDKLNKDWLAARLS